MSDAIIQVENLGKEYTLRHAQQGRRYVALRDVIADTVKGALRRITAISADEKNGATSEQFWALRNVSVEIKRGEVLGIVGRNGSGKSTFLKILSRITPPTEGRVRIRGRVASLLEVGTGFHPELTGRENVFLNGAILGMSNAEMKRKFDEIVAFAEVEKFLDTPVKRYSSGMYVRLAFAVAAHLEPEILIVDEVLAVGDGQFQRKCLGKMQQVSRTEGRTVLFVSHNIGAVLSLCTSAMLLNSGRLEMTGTPKEIVGHYLSSGVSQAEITWNNGSRPGDSTISLHRVRVSDGQDRTVATVDMESPFWIEMAYEICEETRSLQVGLRIQTLDGVVVLTTTDQDTSSSPDVKREPGRYLARCAVPGGLLSPQTYLVSFGALVPNVHVHFVTEPMLEFKVAQTHPRGSTVDDQRQGVISPVLPWNLNRLG